MIEQFRSYKAALASVELSRTYKIIFQFGNKYAVATPEVARSLIDKGHAFPLCAGNKLDRGIK